MAPVLFRKPLFEVVEVEDAAGVLPWRLSDVEDLSLVGALVLEVVSPSSSLFLLGL